MGLLHSAITGCLPLLPRPVMRALAARYIAGEELGSAIERLRLLSGDGYGGILDILGEGVTEEDKARAVVDAYSTAAAELSRESLDAYVSVKPTHVGLQISEELAFDLYSKLAKRCAELGISVRVEMEDHTTVDGTLRIVERLRKTANNVGFVLQSRLFRSLDDIDALAEGPLNVRMVKGIYLEPPEIAHVDPEPIRTAFVECSKRLFARGAFVAFATHDDLLADRLLALCSEHCIGKDRYEFQVLLGVQQPLWRKWRDAGHTVRVYVPYGPEWRSYSTRRLRKNPQILRHLMRDFFSFGKR